MRGAASAPPERHDLRQRAAGQRHLRGRGEVRVGLGRAAHGLGGVVDEDVQRALGGDVVGERDDLARVAHVDADDPQAIEPLGAVVHRGEAPHRVVGEARRDRRVRAVAQQPQGDVHPDLGAAAGEQRAASGQVGARAAPLVVARRAGRTELVVERVDLDVAPLADVAAAGAQERARLRRRRRSASARARASRRRSGRARRSPVAAVTASSCSRIAERRAARRCSLTALNRRPTARRTATASGCSLGSCSTSARTRSASARRSGSMLSMSLHSVERRAYVTVPELQRARAAGARGHRPPRARPRPGLSRDRDRVYARPRDDRRAAHVLLRPRQPRPPRPRRPRRTRSSGSTAASTGPTASTTRRRSAASSEAIAADSGFAMAHWGVAYAAGPTTTSPGSSSTRSTCARSLRKCSYDATERAPSSPPTPRRSSGR